MSKEIKKDEVVIEETMVEEAVTTPKETASRKTRTRKRKPKVEEVKESKETKETKGTKETKPSEQTKDTKPTKETKYSVTVYSKPNCHQCDFTKKYLNEMGTPFNEIDVTQDKEALEQLQHHGYLGVPVVAINSLADSWGGFRPDELEKLRGVKK